MIVQLFSHNEVVLLQRIDTKYVILGVLNRFLTCRCQTLKLGESKDDRPDLSPWNVLVRVEHGGICQSTRKTSPYCSNLRNDFTPRMTLPWKTSNPFHSPISKHIGWFKSEGRYHFLVDPEENCLTHSKSSVFTWQDYVVFKLFSGNFYLTAPLLKPLEGVELQLNSSKGPWNST